MLTSPSKNQLPQPSLHQRALGHGRLGLVNTNGQTQIDELYQQGCAKIRIPHRRNNSLEAIMINSSGGMTGEDQMDWRFAIGKDCTASITTQACEKIYKSTQGVVQTNVKITLGERAKLSWLPQETILFNQAALSRTIEADIAADAEVLFVEPLIFGRGEMGEQLTQGYFKDRWRIKQNDTLIHSEEFMLQGEIANQMANPFVTDGNNALATILFISPSAVGFLEPTRKIIGDNNGASHWNGKLLVRLIARDGYGLRKTLIPLINLLNFGADVPKIWSL